MFHTFAYLDIKLYLPRMALQSGRLCRPLRPQHRRFNLLKNHTLISVRICSKSLMFCVALNRFPNSRRNGSNFAPIGLVGQLLYSTVKPCTNRRTRSHPRKKVTVTRLAFLLSPEKLPSPAESVLQKAFSRSGDGKSVKIKEETCKLKSSGKMKVASNFHKSKMGIAKAPPKIKATSHKALAN